MFSKLLSAHSVSRHFEEAVGFGVLAVPVLSRGVVHEPGASARSTVVKLSLSLSASLWSTGDNISDPPIHANTKKKRWRWSMFLRPHSVIVVPKPY